MATERKVCTLCAAGPCVWYLARTQCNENGNPVLNPTTGKPDYIITGEPILFDPESVCPEYENAISQK